MTDLSGLFRPDRVAVVGATERPGAIGRALVENLTRFEGTVLPVNPSRETVLGLDCYPSIDAVPDVETIDLAVVAVPADVAVEVVREIGQAGVRNVVVVTAGFAEAGPEGRERERDLAAVAREHDLRLVGPNCVGVIGTAVGLDATFVDGYPDPGPVSLMSQSGAFVAATLGWAVRHDVGFRDVVSLGNEAVLDEVDFLEHWREDPETAVVLAYVEDIEDGSRFVETARAVTPDTPVVAIKAGRTASGARAAASHTGSMAGREEAYAAAFAEAGVVRAGGIEAGLDFAQVLAGQPAPTTETTAIVTNGGGPGVLAADAVEDSRLTLAEVDRPLATTLRERLPARVEPTNPLDLIGDADVDRYREALDAVLGSTAVGGAVVISVPTTLFDVTDLVDVIDSVRARHGKPVVTCLMGGEPAERAAADLAALGIPNHFDPGRAVRSLACLADHRAIAGREYGAPRTFDVDRERATEIVADADRERLGVEATELLSAYGIPVPDGELVDSPEAARAAAERLGGPVVLKLASPDLVHKSDVGGVAVGVPVAEVAATYERLRERATATRPDATVLGVRVEELVALPESTETIVGVTRDPQFGHLVMFGLGGVFVQVFDDTAFRIAPVTEREARGMTAEIQAAPMLRGARGRAPADLDAVVETIERVSRLVEDVPEIAELDVNPLVVSPAGVRAVDFRARLDPPTADEGSD